MRFRLYFIIILCLLNLTINAQEVREFIDLQMHPTMHITYPFFGEGFHYFEPEDEPKLSYKHQFRNVNHANYWRDNEGARIIVAGALTKEGIKNPTKARKIILEQLDYINDFAEDYSDDFVVAKSPQEVRVLLATTNKTIIIHSIEGAKKLITSQEDANFWASEGVAFITLIHLVDSEFGSAAIRPGFFTKLINFKGFIKKDKNRVGLTKMGENAIRWLANAGIMTDITHMSDRCRTDALNFMEKNNIPPIATHDGFKPIQNHPRGIPKYQVLQIYRNNGFISLPISGVSLLPFKPEARYQAAIDSLDCYCNGSIDTYKFTYLAVKELIEANLYQIIGVDSTYSFATLNETEKVNFSIGFQSDFNGWLNHSRPRYGKKGCLPLDPNIEYKRIEVEGMSHPGLLQSQWTLLEKEGVDLNPIRRNSEKFLQLWELFLNRRESIGG